MEEEEAKRNYTETRDEKDKSDCSFKIKQMPF